MASGWRTRLQLAWLETFLRRVTHGQKLKDCTSHQPRELATGRYIARVFGGKLPRKRAALAVPEAVEILSREVVVPFPKPHRLRRRATVASRHAAVAPFDDNESDEAE